MSTPTKIAGVTNIGLIPDGSEPPLAVQSAEYQRLQLQALKDEADGKNDTSFKPEEWGL